MLGWAVKSPMMVLGAQSGNLELTSVSRETRRAGQSMALIFYFHASQTPNYELSFSGLDMKKLYSVLFLPFFLVLPRQTLGSLLRLLYM